MYKGLEKIRTNEEYEAKKRELKYYVDEYSWLTRSKDPLRDIAERMKIMLDRLENEENQEKQLRILKNIHVLQVRYVAVKKGEYRNDLKRDITATLVLIEQYEATLENHSFWKIVSGALTGNEEIKSYLQRRYTVSSANRNHAAPNAIDLRMEKIEDILDYIDKNYNLVEIKVPTEETGLILSSEEVDNPVQQKIQQMTENFLTQELGQFETSDLTETQKEKMKKKKGKTIQNQHQVPVHKNRDIGGKEIE